MTKVTITLGGVDHEIDQLPIGVLRDLDAEIANTPLPEMTAKEKETFFFDQALQIIFLAMKTKNPTITLDEIKLIRSNMGEFFGARRKILEHAGLVVDKDAKPGERPAAAS